jgi:hypothetical protein
MSPTVSALLLIGLLEDFSAISPPRRAIRPPWDGAEAAARVGDSPAVGSRAIDARGAQAWMRARPLNPSDPDIRVIIHGAAPTALAAWKTVRDLDPAAGIDVPRGFDQRQAAAGHWNLGILADVPRTTPVTVGLGLQPGWRDALRLIAARGRAVRFHVGTVEGPGSRPMADAIHAAVAEGCPFAWSCAPWPALSGGGDGALPGILNVLSATALALRGADTGTIAKELRNTQAPDILGAVEGLDSVAAREVRNLLSGFAVPRPESAVAALIGLGALPDVVDRPDDQPQPNRAA